MTWPLALALARPASARAMARTYANKAVHAQWGINLYHRSYQTAFLFPGQGSQSVGMSAINGVESVAARAEIKQLYETASSILDYDLHQLCLEGPKEAVHSTKVAQVAIFVNSMAALVKLKYDNGQAIQQCSVAMGLSLGEYSALCFAGALSFEDGVRLTKARGEAMQVASDGRQGGMVAVTGVEEDIILRMCREATGADTATATSSAEADEELDKKPPFLAIANYLGTTNFAVSGDLAACKALQAAAVMEPGVRVSRLLAVCGAFHTPLMRPATQTLAAELDKATFTPEQMSCPVYANVTGDTAYDVHSSESDIKTALLEQLVRPVRWDKSMHLLLSNPDFVQAYEIGPGTVCSGVVKMYNRRAKVTSIQL